VRPILGILAAAAVAVLGAAVLGEYAFDGPAVVGSGIVLGLLVAEAVVTVAGNGSRLGASFVAGVSAAGLIAAGLSAAGLVGAGWISTGHRLGTVRWEGWTAVAIGAAVAMFRARPRSGAQGPATRNNTPQPS